jgi:hypothetical protein
MIELAPAGVATRADGGSVPRRTHAVAGVLYGAGFFGLWGGLPALWGLGFGVLALVAACIITALAQRRHHQPPPTRLGVTPRSLLGAWTGGGPVLFWMVLPDDAGSAMLISLAALFATLFYATLRLEDTASTAREAVATPADA